MATFSNLCVSRSNHKVCYATFWRIHKTGSCAPAKIKALFVCQVQSAIDYIRLLTVAKISEVQHDFFGSRNASRKKITNSFKKDSRESKRKTW